MLLSKYDCHNQRTLGSTTLDDLERPLRTLFGNTNEYMIYHSVRVFSQPATKNDVAYGRPMIVSDYSL